MPESAGRHVFPPSRVFAIPSVAPEVEASTAPAGRSRSAAPRLAPSAAPGASAVGCPEDTLFPRGDVERSRIAGVEREGGEVVGGCPARRLPGQPTVSGHEHTGGAHGIDGSGAGRVDGDRPEISVVAQHGAPGRAAVRGHRDRAVPLSVRPGALHCREQDPRVRRVDRQRMTKLGDAGSVRHVLPPSTDLLTWPAATPATA